MEESQKNIYPLVKEKEIKNKTTITIHSQKSLDLQ